MRATTILSALGLATILTAPAPGDDLSAALKKLQAVGPHAQGHGAAQAAWADVARAEVGQLPTVLAALDGANPLAANWIRTAVDAIAERELAGGGPAAAERAGGLHRPAGARAARPPAGLRMAAAR